MKINKFLYSDAFKGKTCTHDSYGPVDVVTVAVAVAVAVVMRLYCSLRPIQVQVQE